MIKIAICDDNQNDCDRVHGFVMEYLDVKNIPAQVRTFNHPDTLVTECEEYRPHIYILDIVMPMITGIQAARELRWNQPTAQIIFATSEKSYALESFDVNPINYILKPIEKEKLFSQVNSFKNPLLSNNMQVSQRLPFQILSRILFVQDNAINIQSFGCIQLPQAFDEAINRKISHT